MFLFNLGTWRTFPATSGRFMLSPVGGPRFEPEALWIKSLHFHPYVISTIKADGPHDSPGLLEVQGCLTTFQPPNGEQLR